jgi:hypothetical protein
MPNKATLVLKDFARQFLESDDYRRKLRARILRGQAPKLEELLYHYAYGKPREATEDGGQNGVWVSQAEIKRAADDCREKLAHVFARQRNTDAPDSPSARLRGD